MSKYENITEAIGNTPIVRINKLAPENCKLYAKVEYFNPAGSERIISQSCRSCLMFHSYMDVEGRCPERKDILYHGIDICICLLVGGIVSLPHDYHNDKKARIWKTYGKYSFSIMKASGG